MSEQSQSEYTPVPLTKVDKIAPKIDISSPYLKIGASVTIQRTNGVIEAGWRVIGQPQLTESGDDYLILTEKNDGTKRQTLASNILAHTSNPVAKESGGYQKPTINDLQARAEQLEIIKFNGQTYRPSEFMELARQMIKDAPQLGSPRVATSQETGLDMALNRILNSLCGDAWSKDRPKIR